MLKFVILLSAITCALAGTIPEGLLPQLDGRIVGGTATTISSFPWQVSIERNGKHSCGGSIYSVDIIITAAHCLQNVNPTTLKVRVGSTYSEEGGILIDIETFENHENYNSVTNVNDVGIIKLKTPLTFSADIRPIGLAKSTPPNNAQAVVSGYGAVEYHGYQSERLLYANVYIVSKEDCGGKSYGYGSLIKDGMICARFEGRDACQGDSGGPLVSGGELVGIVSWGHGCAYLYYPGVYINIADSRDWIINAASHI